MDRQPDQAPGAWKYWKSRGKTRFPGSQALKIMKWAASQTRLRICKYWKPFKKIRFFSRGQGFFEPDQVPLIILKIVRENKVSWFQGLDNNEDWLPARRGSQGLKVLKIIWKTMVVQPGQGLTMKTIAFQAEGASQFRATGLESIEDRSQPGQGLTITNAPHCI